MYVPCLFRPFWIWANWNSFLTGVLFEASKSSSPAAGAQEDNAAMSLRTQTSVTAYMWPCIAAAAYLHKQGDNGLGVC